MKDDRPPPFSLEEVSRRTEASPKQIREWRSLGFLGAAGKEGFTLEDVELVRLIELCLERGFDAQAIAQAEKQQKGFLGHYLAQLFPDGIAPTYVKGARKVIDPVCGMELTSAGIAARLMLEGSERVFCSENCLRMFVEAPAKYGG